MLEIIKAVPLLSGLPAHELKALIGDNQLYVKSYTKKATIYNQKDSCSTLDIVLSGSLVAYSLLENGSAMAMFEFTRGQILGANLLFSDRGEYPFTIYCMADARILHISKKAVSAFLHSYSFTVEFIKMLSLNSQKLNQRVTIATQKSLKENILEYLRQQSLLQNSNKIILPISKKQLADYLGVQRPSLFRELKNLKDEGLINIENRTIYLINRD